MITKIKNKMSSIHKRVRVKYVFVRTRLNGRMRTILVSLFVIFAVLSIIFQLLYPSNRLTFFTVIDGQNYSGWTKNDTIESLSTAYANMPIELYFGGSQGPYVSPSTSQLGLIANVPDAISKLDYPWYLRLVPSSILWVNLFNNQQVDFQKNDETIGAFMRDNLGDSCNIEPKNAELSVLDGDVSVIPSMVGGQCEVSAAIAAIGDISPKLSNGDSRKVYISVDEVLPSINDEDATNFRNDLVSKISDGVVISVNKTQHTISYGDLIKWIDFSEQKGAISYSFNEDRALEYFQAEIAPSVSMSAGTTTINVYNFSETSRFDGASGQRLDLAATLKSIQQYIDGEKETASVVVAIIEPRIVYNRQYSADDEGLSALMKNFASSHYGSYGVSLIELDGQNRTASYNGTKSFVTASTYKLFVAYSILKKIESGEWKWADTTTVSGKSVSVCFDDMISKSDNACAEYFLVKIGQKKITDDAHAIGCSATTFLGSENIETTPADLALFLAKLKSKEILSSQSSRDKLLNAMSGNIYRQGIPAGLSGLSVADKVGFLWSLLHDAAVVTGSTGSYVLVIMTNGSSWTNIAELARQIEALRIQ